MARGETMKIKENLLAQTRIDEETGRLMEKYIEGFSYYLPIYHDISVLLPEKNDEGLIDICNMSLMDDGSVALTDGDFWDYKSKPAMKEVLLNCRGKCYYGSEDSSTVLYLPICHNSAEPIGILKLSGVSERADLNVGKYLETIKKHDDMNKIYDCCFTKFILDPVFFRESDGKVQNINATAALFKSRICDGAEIGLPICGKSSKEALRSKRSLKKKSAWVQITRSGSMISLSCSCRSVCMEKIRVRSSV